MPIIKKIHMFIMMAQDKLFEDTVAFYKKIGLTPKFHLKDKWAEFEIKNILLGICPTDQELPERRTGIVMEVEDLIIELIKSRNVKGTVISPCKNRKGR